MELKILVSEDDLKKRIEQVADEINNLYKNETLTLICVLKGAIMFYTELAKHLKMPVKMEFISLSSYGCSKTSSGKVSALNVSLPPLEGEKVLIVEDIIDTGLTLKFLLDYLQTKCGAKDVKLAVLLDKKCARKYDITPDFSAFEVDDKFVVGFGLDCNELDRNLPYIGYYSD